MLSGAEIAEIHETSQAWCMHSDEDIAIYQGAEIRFAGQLINLTNMWKAASGDESKRPVQWYRHGPVVQLIEALAKKLNCVPEHVLQVRAGRYGGTYAHYQLALAYAQYLSPDFHMWCNEV